MATCPRCGGKGTIPCKDCSGTGSGYFGKCATCGGRREVKCPNCRGTGRV